MPITIPASPCPPPTPRVTSAVRSAAPVHARVRGLAVVAAGAMLLAGCVGDASTEPANPTTTAAVADAGSASVGDDAVTIDTPAPDDSAPTSAPDATEDAAVDTPPPLHPSVDDFPAGRVVVEPGDGAEPIPVAVRIADTPERRAHGLMEVEEVPDGAGMWFAYDEDSTGRYYMLGTRIDLDIAWVDAGGTIVATETMTECPEEPCERYDPQAAYRNALEVSAGWLAANGVAVGDRITLDQAAS